MSSSNNNKQPQYITASLPAATQGLSKEECVGLAKELVVCATRRENRPSIYKVSRILRDPSKSSFDPHLVSIGPIHREVPKLKEFQWLKECYLNGLLGRSDSTPETILEACLLEVNTLIPRIRESYGDMIKNCSNAKLAKMMVMDVCFVLEFCFSHEDEDLDLPTKMQNLRIAMDLMLLENQLPFVVLQDLYKCLAPYIFGEEVSVPLLTQVLDIHLAPYIMLFHVFPEKKSNLSNVLDKYLAPYIKLFGSLLPEKISTKDEPKHAEASNPVGSGSTPAHVLGYLHKLYQLVAAKPSKPVDEGGIKNTPFHSIVELDRSGVNFRPHQEDGWSMTIKFQSSPFACLPWFWKPTLLMPTLVIDDTTELILMNFIAYEQLFPQEHHYFTSYAIAMDKLIDSQEDIAKLVESKVLVNNLGSKQEAADMINRICKNMFATDFYYTDEFKRMDKYYNGYWPNNIAWLRRVYFNNPWNAIALLGAIILFGLTVVQTVYTIRAA